MQAGRKKKIEKTAKASKKQTRAAKKREQPHAAAEAAAQSREDFLFRNALNKRHEARRTLGMQDIIYNFEKETKELAYRYGYEIGEALFKHFNSDNTLSKMLESAGFGKILYYPFESKTMITSYAVDNLGMNSSIKMHDFEAGIMAGYLSQHSKTRLDAEEVHCKFAGSEFCQFVISQRTAVREAGEGIGDIDTASMMAMKALKGGKYGGACESYYLLESAPLEREPLRHIVRKMLFVLGKKISGKEEEAGREGNAAGKAAAFARLSGYAGVDAVSMAGKKPNALRLRYSHLNSASGFIDLSSSLLAGFANGAYKRKIKVVKRLNANGSYTVELQFL